MHARTVFVVALVSLAGCWSGSAPLASIASSRQALQVALDAWKTGKPASSLTQGEPKIEAVDFEWRAGETLTAYTLGADTPGQGTRIFSVSLTLKGQSSKEVKYMIMGIDPIRIYRDEDFTRAMNMENNPSPAKKRNR